MVAAFKSEWVAAFKSEYPAGFIGICRLRTISLRDQQPDERDRGGHIGSGHRGIDATRYKPGRDEPGEIGNRA